MSMAARPLYPCLDRQTGETIWSIYLLSTGVSFCGDVGVAPEVRGSGRIGDPNQLIPMIKMVIMAQIHMKIFKPFDRAIRETHCLKLIVIKPLPLNLVFNNRYVSIW
jgi:hypothetical protein